MEQTPKDRITAATLELIASHGLGGVTMTAVARRASVARQTLYNHYPDVESIVAAALVRHQKESVTRLRELLATVESPLARLEHLVRHYAAMAGQGHGVRHGGFSPQIQGVLDEYDAAVRGEIESALRDGLRADLFRPTIDPGRDSLLLLRMIETTSELVIADPSAVTTIVSAVSEAVGRVVSVGTTAPT